MRWLIRLAILLWAAPAAAAITFPSGGNATGPAPTTAAGATYVLTVDDAGWAINDLALVTCAMHSTIAATGVSTNHTVTDSHSHKYERLAEYSQLVSGSDYVTVSMWIVKLTTAFTQSVSQITGNSGDANSRAKSCSLIELNLSSPTTLTFSNAGPGSGAHGAGGTSATPTSGTISGLSAAARAWWVLTAVAHAGSGTITCDGAYTCQGTLVGNTGANATSVNASRSRIADTGAGDGVNAQTSETWVGGFTASRTYAVILVALDEVSTGGGPVSRRGLSLLGVGN